MNEIRSGLTAIKTLLSRDPCVHANTAIQMIDAILAEQPAQQEPVARVFNKSISWRPCDIAGLPAGTPLYTSPPAQRTWVGLTHEEIDYQAKKDDHAVYFALGALWAEAKLKEKNA